MSGRALCLYRMNIESMLNFLLTDVQLGYCLLENSGPYVEFL